MPLGLLLDFVFVFDLGLVFIELLLDDFILLLLLFMVLRSSSQHLSMPLGLGPVGGKLVGSTANVFEVKDNISREAGMSINLLIIEL